VIANKLFIHLLSVFPVGIIIMVRGVIVLLETSPFLPKKATPKNEYNQKRDRYSSMKFMDSLNVEVNIPEKGYQVVNTENYPLDYYWIFTACDEDYGNNHTLCLEDFKIRQKYNGHCVCACHRKVIL